MDRKTEVAFDENELAILLRVVDDDCQKQESPVRIRIRDKISDAICELRNPTPKRPCPKCGKAGEMFTSDLDWCPACGNQWQGT